MAAAQGEAFLAALEPQLGGVPVNFDAFQPVAVFVGQDVTALVTGFGKKIKTGAGIHQERGKVVATRAGVLRFVQPNIYWIEHKGHRYVPQQQENVIGVVTECFAESYRLDISATSTATLPALAFDGASKRNKPTYKVGTLVFARVSKVHRDLEPELSCQVLNGPRKDWMTGQSVYGELKGGFVFSVPLSLADRLQDEDCPVLMAISKAVAFEIAVGANGIVWVNAAKGEEISFISNAIQSSQGLSARDQEKLVASLVSALKKDK